MQSCIFLRWRDRRLRVRAVAISLVSCLDIAGHLAGGDRADAVAGAEAGAALGRAKPIRSCQLGLSSTHNKTIIVFHADVEIAKVTVWDPRQSTSRQAGL